ncbi:MAG: metal-binding protein [Rhodocyclaceae bacterium]|jgi:hypothetical protein|nr:metal-binding protein [Rhodocyclaceae bacterium]
MLKQIVFAAGLAASLHGVQAAGNEALPPVSLYAPAVCLACIDWADHLRKNGFTVALKETADMAALKRRLKVPREVESVPTATVGGYFIEGHVPAEDIKLLLKEKPKARGLAVPGLPMGAPGRESTGSDISCGSGCAILESGTAERPARREMYDTLLVGRDGKTSIYARH